MKKWIVLLLCGLSANSLAATVTHTSKVDKVIVNVRVGVDYGGVQILPKDAIPGTSCAAGDVAKGFYFSSSTAVQGALQKQSYENLAIAAQAQDLPLTFTYDSAACVGGFGINFLTVTLPAPIP